MKAGIAANTVVTVNIERTDEGKVNVHVLCHSVGNFSPRMVEIAQTVRDSIDRALMDLKPGEVVHKNYDPPTITG